MHRSRAACKHVVISMDVPLAPAVIYFDAESDRRDQNPLSGNSAERCNQLLAGYSELASMTCTV